VVHDEVVVAAMVGLKSVAKRTTDETFRKHYAFVLPMYERIKAKKRVHFTIIYK
jgi:hypothetical protein